MNKENLVDKIKEVMRDEKYSLLSLACKNYTSIWYDFDSDEVFVKWSPSWDTDAIYNVKYLCDSDVKKIYDDLIIDFA